MKKLLQRKIDEIYHCVNYSCDFSKVDLFSGSCGSALFNFYYAKFRNDQKAYDKGYNQIIEVIDSINSGFVYHPFSSGLAGIGWTIEHLAKNNFLDIDSDELLSDLDEYLYSKMIEELKKGRYDYLNGSIGISLYFLSRKTLNKKDQYLEALIDELEFLSEKDVNSLKWKSVLYFRTGEEGYSISLSHGIASIALLIGKIYKEGIHQVKAKKLIEGAVNYILKQKKSSDGSYSLFPSHSLENIDTLESRLAWCFGDLGIATTLWQLSKILDRKDWEKESITILLHSAKRRDLVENMVSDAALCHGTVGIAHVFNRMYLSTGIHQLKEASEYWFDQTIKMAQFDDGLAGYKYWKGTEEGWVNDSGFLEGIAGIGLAMISAVSDIDPAWDECLLLS